MNPYFTDYSVYLQRLFGNIAGAPVKVQKISIDAGCSCPNRDGTIGWGGCIYCDNSAFTPAYCGKKRGDVESQLAEGRAFFARKYPRMKYIAYFQSFTFTHRSSAAEVAAMLRRAATVPDVVGIVVGTRPDCLPDEVLDAIATFNRPDFPVMLELGVESMHDATLSRINRGHTAADVESAIVRADVRGVRCGIHLIAGLPGETPDDALDTLRRVCNLSVDCVKLHQLQVIKGTPLYRGWSAGEIDLQLFTLDDYLDFCVQAVSVVRAAPRDIAIERFVAQAPGEMVVAPRWGLKNYQFNQLLLRRLREDKPSSVK